MHVSVCALDEHALMFIHTDVSVGVISGCECVHLCVSVRVLRMSGELGAESASMRCVRGNV